MSIEHIPFMPFGIIFTMAALVVGLCIGYDQGRKERYR